MSAPEIENWLDTKTAKVPAEVSCPSAFVIEKKVSQKIIRILLKRKVLLTKGDYEWMEKVIYQIDKLYDEKPQDNLLVSNWRYALMNLGHDPFKVLDN